MSFWVEKSQRKKTKERMPHHDVKSFGLVTPVPKDHFIMFSLDPRYQTKNYVIFVFEVDWFPAPKLKVLDSAICYQLEGRT